MRYNRLQSVGSRQALSKSKPYGADGDDYITAENSARAVSRSHGDSEIKKKRNISWDDLRVASPITRLKRLLKNIEPPVLPPRKQSGDNLAFEEESAELLKKRRSSRSCSFDHSYLSTGSDRRGSYLDNTVMLVTKIEHPGKGPTSLDDALLVSDENMRQRVQRESPLHDSKLKHNLRQRSGSLDNPLFRAHKDRRFPDSLLGNCQSEMVENSDGDAPTGVTTDSRKRNFKQRILSKLNSPRWKSKAMQVQLPPDVFELEPSDLHSTVPKEATDDFRFGIETSGSSPLLPCRKASDLMLPRLPDNRG